ncbi:MAG: M23 family metallopeptidase [Bacteroidota bacterium]
MTVMLIWPSHIIGQSPYPANYFRSPVDFRILLSGTFGELRSGHFHSGMDIKTGGVSGKNIYAVADGYVSRIKVSATGFGKTLYVTHPNGFVSVYAHLSRFNNDIAPYVKTEQYKSESFAVNLFLKANEFPVKKGEIIAYSGNSGGSNGPHLHFEIRIASTQTPVNPLLFGFEVKDYIRPVIHWLKVIPAGPDARIDGKPEPKVFQVDGWGEQHRIKDNDTIHVSGEVAFAINTYDKLNDANNKNGVYSIALFLDGAKVYSHDLEKFDFKETRYINSLIDYEEYVENKRRYQRTEVDPNNELSIYGDVANRGILSFTTTAIHKLEYVVTDFEGNVSKLPIIIQGSPARSLIGKIEPENGILFSCEQSNTISTEDFELDLPGKSLYRDMWFEYNTSEMPPDAYSVVHHIHHDRTAVHKPYRVKIKPDSLPLHTDKLLLARITDKGDYISYGGEYASGVITASLRSFGDFVILTDTDPPEISSVNIASGNIKSGRKTVRVKIKDNLSGIQAFRATLNGAWLLMEYDAKNSQLIYHIDERLKKGENQFMVEATDRRDNKAVFKKILVR